MDLVEAEGRHFAAVSRHPWERARLAITADLIQRHAALPARSTILDVGCGDTFVAEQLAAKHPGAEVLAVDSAFTESLIELYSSRMGARNVRLFRSLDAVPDAGPTSLILLMDVIEHVADDQAFLSDICQRPWFDGSTRVLVTVPAYQSLFSAHDVALGHYRRYSRRSLRHVLSAVGLAPIAEGSFFTTLVPIRLLQLLRERLQGTTEAPPNLGAWSGGEAAGRVLTTWLTLDGRIGLACSRLGLALPGLSNFAVCRKSA